MPYKYDGETLELYSFHGNTVARFVAKIILISAFYLLYSTFMAIAYNLFCPLGSFEFFAFLTDMARAFFLVAGIAWLIYPFLPCTDVIVTTKSIRFRKVVHLFRSSAEDENRNPVLGVLYTILYDLLKVSREMLDVDRVVMQEVEVPWKYVRRIKMSRFSTMQITFKDGSKAFMELSRYRTRGYFFARESDLESIKTHFFELYKRAKQRHHEEVN